MLLGILQTVLTGDQALNEAPPLVIVALANIYVEGDAEYWMDACIKWSANHLDLALCITIPRDAEMAPADKTPQEWYGRGRRMASRTSAPRE